MKRYYLIDNENCEVSDFVSENDLLESLNSDKEFIEIAVEDYVTGTGSIEERYTILYGEIVKLEIDVSVETRLKKSFE